MTRFVVTGTDTGIGKTIFSAALAGATGAPYWKPIQSGLDEETDSEVVARLAGVPVRPEAYCLNTPASPHFAAEIDGVTIDLATLTPPPATSLSKAPAARSFPLPAPRSTPTTSRAGKSP